MRVEIWSDIVCPWCYIGKARFEKALAAFPNRDQVEVVHRSFELDTSAATSDKSGPVAEMLAGKYGMTLAQAKNAEKSVADAAAGEGLRYNTERVNGNTFDQHRLLHLAKREGRQLETLDAFYRANFADAVPVNDVEGTVSAAVSAGLDETEVRATLADPEAFADEVRADEREAAALGASGVPFFVIDRKYGISGAQPPETFAQALSTAWSDAHPTLLTVEGDPSAPECTDDGCAVPQK
ncbi:DsbA family oxidoreductase [Phytomonospora endophytica]|uniref:Putative DsbA family dithiol-disulfide isomerase n=1 Tax=Phytomonospora endophytica TaxID=714109 RepID=A0A841FR25_9ACTN|nr:DsbA family oxidoreductase [Phytomonospora endophytica]MBB6036238.1 putative DsbA family dithiol-disulfide isomerase [Phytomonospora endophytica]GIG67144.1 DSBA oxidoreductase [Phytomonospora endophytica]